MKASALLLLAVPAVQGFAPATLRRNTVAVRRGNVEMLSMPRFGRKQAQLPVAPVLSNAAPSQDVATHCHHSPSQVGHRCPGGQLEQIRGKGCARLGNSDRLVLALPKGPLALRCGRDARGQAGGGAHRAGPPRAWCPAGCRATGGTPCRAPSSSVAPPVWPRRRASTPVSPARTPRECAHAANASERALRALSEDNKKDPAFSAGACHLALALTVAPAPSLNSF